jgi:hypothetical protein
MAVINALGHGLREKSYERALCVAFESRGFSFREQHIYPVTDIYLFHQSMNRRCRVNRKDLLPDGWLFQRLEFVFEHGAGKEGKDALCLLRLAP